MKNFDAKTVKFPPEIRYLSFFYQECHSGFSTKRVFNFKNKFAGGTNPLLLENKN